MICFPVFSTLVMHSNNSMPQIFCFGQKSETLSIINLWVAKYTLKLAYIGYLFITLVRKTFHNVYSMKQITLT